jgi:hypothetical protein
MSDAVLTAAPPIELRPYQRDALTAIEAATLRACGARWWACPRVRAKR